MSTSPVDLSPFRILVDFFAGAHFALVSIAADSGAEHGAVPNWIEFVDPDIGIFGLSKDWELPAGEEDKTLVYGYHVVIAHVAGRKACIPWIFWRETRARTASMAVWA